MYVARGESEPAVMQTMGGEETPVTVFSQVHTHTHTHTQNIVRHRHKAEKEKGTACNLRRKWRFDIGVRFVQAAVFFFGGSHCVSWAERFGGNNC